MDFTLKKYRSLIAALKETSIPFIGFSDIVRGDYEQFTVLRHDVDRQPKNAMEMAMAEAG